MRSVIASAQLRTARPAPRDRPAIIVWLALVGVGIGVGGRLAAANPGFATDAAPFHGHWDLHVGAGVVIPVVVAVGVVGWGPIIADRISWGRLVLVAPLAAFAWSGALALTAGGHGFTSPLATRYEYLAGVRAVDGPAAFLRSFTDLAPTLPTHVKSHPPGLVLVLWALDRIAFGAPVWAALMVVAVGASAVAAVLLTVRNVAGDTTARRAAPFLVLAPAAVWMATSGDAFFTGIGAWSVAATVLATSRRHLGWAVVAGTLWTAALFVSYGLVLLAPVAIGVAWRRRRLDVLRAAGATAVVTLGVIGVVTGFWWPTGLAVTHRAYLAGIAPHRPAAVFVWLNLAAIAVAVGPAIAPALRRARGPAALLPGGALVGLAAADLSLLSKAEVERIWLPWVPWLLVAAAAIAVGRRRPWLAAQAATGLAVQLALRSPW